MAKKILIADDEAMVRDLIKFSIEKEGYEVFEAKNGIEALTLAKELMPDLIILDIMMPGKGGYQVCSELKADPETKMITILFLTSRSGTLSAEAAKESGGDGFLTKPFRPHELKMKIKNVLLK